MALAQTNRTPPQVNPYVLHLTDQFYLAYILLLTITEALVLAQWGLSKKLKAIKTILRELLCEPVYKA